MEGYTLALDFPVNKKTFDLMNKLDSITVRHKGVFILQKIVECPQIYFKNQNSVYKSTSSIDKAWQTKIFLPVAVRKVKILNQDILLVLGLEVILGSLLHPLPKRL